MQISKRKLGKLIDHNILAIEDLPDDFELSDAQKNQVCAANSKQVMIDEAAIEKACRADIKKAVEHFRGSYTDAARANPQK